MILIAQPKLKCGLNLFKENRMSKAIVYAILVFSTFMCGCIYHDRDQDRDRDRVFIEKRREGHEERDRDRGGHEHEEQHEERHEDSH